MKGTFENYYPLWARIIFFKSTFLQWIEIISEVYSYLYDASLFKSVFLNQTSYFLLFTKISDPSKECIFSLSFVKS